MLHIFTKSMAYSSQSLHVSFERQTSVWNINNKLVIFLLLTSWADSDTSTTCHHTDIGSYLISHNRYTGIPHQLHQNHYIQYKQQVHTIISQVTAGVNHLRERVGHCVTHSCLMMMPTELVKKKKKKQTLWLKPLTNWKLYDTADTSAFWSPGYSITQYTCEQVADDLKHSCGVQYLSQQSGHTVS